MITKEWVGRTFLDEKHNCIIDTSIDVSLNWPAVEGRPKK